MKKIDISTRRHPNTFTIVDDEDYDELNKLKWHRSDTGYAVRRYKVNGIKTTFRMHRIIINAPKEKEVDHINCDPLDNRKCNLRTCTRHENLLNRRVVPNTSSKYKGVTWYKPYKKWRAMIGYKKKPMHIGYFDSEIDAAISYNDAAIKYFGEFANLNNIPA
jgi:hypothetical protein